ncbi:hypothetical protein D9M71_656400 [compost metagenome]
MHVIAGGLHQHVAHVRATQFQQALPATDIDDLNMLAFKGRAQLLLDCQLLTAGYDQQPLVGADPLQRHVLVGDHGQRHGQLQAKGLVHAGGEFRVVAITTQGEVTEELAFTQGHACVLAAFAYQAGQVGMVQWRLGFGLGAGVLLEDVDSAHFLPALNSCSSGQRSRAIRLRRHPGP